MASSTASSDVTPECPVCHESYGEPKILPCTHIVCRNCLLSWLDKGGCQAGCPMCRAPILPSSHQGQSDLATQVDAFPTDLAIVVLAESVKILQVSRHLCSLCDDDVKATSYCLHCDVKLCKPCTNYHRKVPGTRDHALERLGKLTAQRLAATRRLPCNRHCDTPAELYCPVHQELICLLCLSATHENCPGRRSVSDMAKVMRAELTQRAERLRDTASSLSEQIKQVTEAFKVMWREVKDTFDDLQQALEKRRDEVNTHIKNAEEAAMTSLAVVEKLKTAVTSNAASVEQLVVTSPDHALLEMMKKLTLRLDDLEFQTKKPVKVKVPADVIFEPQTLTRLKLAIRNFGRPSASRVCCPACGQRMQPPSATAATGGAVAKPTGADLARVLSVGDRVKRGSGWISGNVDGSPPGAGTVTKIGRGGNKGWVWVQWDAGSVVWWHDMGYGHYELELA